MLYLALKALISGPLAAAVPEIARRSPGFAGRIASLPLVSVPGMIRLWRDKPDVANMAAHAERAVWFVPPSLPMFLVIPALLRRGVAFWGALAVGCGLTVGLDSAMGSSGPRRALKR